MFPNKRGTAIRHGEKRIRVATHSSVLKLCISIFSGSFDIIEHGMGISSTPLFHSSPGVRKFLSIETEPQWMNCDTCNADPTMKMMHIIANPKMKDLSTTFQQVIGSFERCLVFADGPGFERRDVVKTAMQLGAQYIVEHDAETYANNDLISRRNIAEEHGYSAYQFLGEDPETALFIKQKPLAFEPPSGSYVVL